GGAGQMMRRGAVLTGGVDITGALRSEAVAVEPRGAVGPIANAFLSAARAVFGAEASKQVVGLPQFVSRPALLFRVALPLGLGQGLTGNRRCLEERGQDEHDQDRYGGGDELSHACSPLRSGWNRVSDHWPVTATGRLTWGQSTANASARFSAFP